MKETVFVIGGCRSGKSRHALDTAECFAGKEQIFDAYQDAVKKGYRFFSYGDAMAIITKR